MAGSLSRLLRHARLLVRRVRLRDLAALVLVGLGFGAAAILAEALIRARIGPPSARVPTALFSRPAAWGAWPGRAGAVPIAPLSDALDEWRIPTRLADLPAHLVEAVLAVEDQRFFQHDGLDLRRIMGAAVANARAGQVTQGGSTITQQLAKNLFLSAQRTPLRKLREAVMAVVLEDRHDKAAILQAYLNEIYLGQDGPRAIHGVGAAARYYFDRDAADLTLAEGALLAGMIRAPNWYTPVRHPDRARERRDLVLRLMVEQGRLDERAARRAASQRIRTRPVPQTMVDARYFRDFVVRRFRKEYGGRLPPRGTTVYTTLDAVLQRAANRAVRDGLAGLSVPDAQAALVAIDPRTGDILAMVGGRDYGASQFNRATDARRQPGSAFKPIVALVALGRNGSDVPPFTLASVIPDEPLSVVTPVGRWAPRNYDQRFRGPVTLRQALEQSLNVPFARIGLSVGADRIATMGKQLGISSRLQAVPSLALGSSEVTPLELTRAFGVFANGGALAETRSVLGVARGDGSVRNAGSPVLHRAVDPAEAYLVTSALEGAVQRGTGRALGRLDFSGGLAGKSGTSSEWRDGWFIAYTPSLTVGVWVGHDDGRSLGLTGSRSALPIVMRFLREALRQADTEPFPVPEGVEFAHVRTERDWWGWTCDGEPEVFLEGTAPHDDCGDWWAPLRWASRIGRLPGQLFGGLADLLGLDQDDAAELLEREANEVVRELAAQLDRASRELRRH
ncbi:MAG TPA: PBP1A family penicillin-binding protein [Gemmatimonadales bacterium]|nr:PBP1A family penicillin-binding protein [Gemmatimonadales bacterium]